MKSWNKLVYSILMPWNEKATRGEMKGKTGC